VQRSHEFDIPLSASWRKHNRSLAANHEAVTKLASDFRRHLSPTALLWQEKRLIMTKSSSIAAADMSAAFHHSLVEFPFMVREAVSLRI